MGVGVTFVGMSSLHRLIICTEWRCYQPPRRSFSRFLHPPIFSSFFLTVSLGFPLLFRNSVALYTYLVPSFSSSVLLLTHLHEFVHSLACRPLSLSESNGGIVHLLRPGAVPIYIRYPILHKIEDTLPRLSVVFLYVSHYRFLCVLGGE